MRLKQRERASGRVRENFFHPSPGGRVFLAAFQPLLLPLAIRSWLHRAAGAPLCAGPCRGRSVCVALWSEGVRELLGLCELW